MHNYLRVTLINIHDEFSKRMDAPALASALSSASPAIIRQVRRRRWPRRGGFSAQHSFVSWSLSRSAYDQLRNATMAVSGKRQEPKNHLKSNGTNEFQLSAYDHLRNDGWCSAPLSVVSGAKAPVMLRTCSLRSTQGDFP